MRILLIVAGIVIAALGAATLMGKLNYEKKDEVAKIGGVSISASHDKSAPQWAGIAGLVIGGALVLGGALKKG